MGPDEFDMDNGVAEIAGSLGLDAPEAEAPLDDPAADPPIAEGDAAPVSTAPTVRPPPKSWAKDYHEPWTKADPKLQEYIEHREKQMLDGIEQYKADSTLGKTLKDVITPYRPMIEAHGMDEAKAVGYLMNAHWRLTQGSPEQRLAAFNELGRNLGFLQRDPNAQPADPKLSAVEERQTKIEARLNQEAQRRYQETQEKVSTQVSSFASAKDEKGAPLHPYFDDVADDIIVYINAGHELEDAYKRAVYANPVTREKEIARLKTEHDKQLRDKAKQGAETARRASSTNVRSRDTSRAPTGLVGTIEDTLKETLAASKARTH